MRIAIASGKGGTGKTTVAVNLLTAVAQLPLSERPSEMLFLDCDVEEPNAHLFLTPCLTQREAVPLLLPEVDFDKCTYCGKCAEVCVYHAIAVVGHQVMVFPQLCHGCGSCTYNCPEQAIHEVPHPIGYLAWGTAMAGEVRFRFGQGEINVGEALATPIIRRLKKRLLPTVPEEGLALLDAPPGNSCPVVETMRGMDFVLLVTEPTPFGLHDLRGAVAVARDELGLPVGVVINRDGVGDVGVERFCAEADIPILMRIPLERRIAEAYAEGVMLVHAVPSYRQAFVDLYRQIVALGAPEEA